MTVPANLQKRGWRFWGLNGFRFVAAILLFVGIMNGRHPPAFAQESSADMHRDDSIQEIQKDVDANKSTVQRQWSEINDLKKTVQQMQIDAAAGTSTSNKVATGEIVALLASFGMQVRGGKKKSKEGDDD